jgi:hypothetical protein
MNAPAIIGFTGTRQPITAAQLKTLNAALMTFRLQGATDFHHGQCVGADHAADSLARGLGYKIVSHPANDVDPVNIATIDKDATYFYPPAPALRRNDRIAKMCDILLACPKEFTETTRSGTWSTVRKARKARRLIFIIYPDGTIVEEARRS